MSADSIAQRLDAWVTLDALVTGDLTVTGVEVARFGSIYSATIRRNRPVHSIQGTGSTPADALAEARRLYREDDE